MDALGRAILRFGRRCGIVRFRIDTLIPGASASCPVTTTVSPGCNPAFDYGQIAILPLARFHRPEIDGVVRFHHKNKRTALTDLHRLRRNQLASLIRSRMKRTRTNSDGHKRAIGIRRDRARFHRAGTGLNRVVDEIQIALRGAEYCRRATRSALSRSVRRDISALTPNRFQQR